MLWTPPNALPSRQIPTSACFEYHFDMERKQVELAPSEIMTPSSRITLSGALGSNDSSLVATIDTEDLSAYDDFINRIRGRTADPQAIGRHFHWQGRLTVPLAGPTFPCVDNE